VTDDGTHTARAPDGDGLAWEKLSRTARLYVAAVMIAGAGVFLALLPTTLPDPILFAALLLLATLTSVWKVNLPIPLASGSTLSVSYAADLMTLLLLGPRHAMVVAVIGAWMQCTVKVKRPYPLYRTVFSVAAEALTMGATGWVYVFSGGELAPLELAKAAKPIVVTIAAYFVVNTGLIAGAIAATSERTWWRVWRDDFLWSGASFMVAGTAGAAAAVVIARGEHWKALLLLAPVYLTYRTYQVFVGRLEDQRGHTLETQRLHKETIAALTLARDAEQALAREKERLASMVSELTRLEQMRAHLLQREKAARSKAEEASRLKDQFLAMVSHELRTPLNAILGWADMLRTGRLEGEAQARASESIFSSAKRQAHLVDELLDVARITSGKIRLTRTVVDLHEVVRDALEVVQAAADAKNVRITIEPDPTLGSTFGDPARLQQIAWNLLSNAVKFTPDGGSVLVRLRRQNNITEMVVSDTGAGIPPEFLPWVFEPFLQADASTTRPFGGLGLGLSIVRHLVEAHGGHISVASGGEGQGATFTVRLPIVAVYNGQSRPPADDASAAAAPGPIASLGGVSVLIVDDDAESREVVAASLHSHGAVVQTAESVPQALNILQRERVDVLVADIAMPGEDGYALMRRLRALDARAASIPAAALTALARDDDRDRALEAGFQLHLVKPVDAATLVSAVASLARLNAA
jgi:signal transduction histidine kinase